MTISLWVKYEAITDDAHLFDFGNGDTNNNIKIKNHQTTNKLQLEITQGIDSAATTKTVEASNYIDTDPFDVTNVLFTTRLERVQAAGGWKKYERTHRMRLTTTFARVVFPRVPTEVVAHIVSLWAHVGYY